MTSQRWREIEELYHSACERGLAVLEGTDPEIRREVEKLLSHDSEKIDKLLDHPVAGLISELTENPVTPGSRLGPYRIEALIGQGGMGRVYRAVDTRLNRQVAIKICRVSFSGRFEQEARSIAAINHPNVCTLHDVGPSYLVMEFVEGETLAARLKRGRLPIKEIARFGAQIAEALAVAHARGIIHRDLKPGNIMLTKSGVKVLDFGLAKSSGDPALTDTDGVMGTPAYMAPERLEGKAADARSDIYALGLVLSEMATGKRSETPTVLPPGLDRIVQRCLEADPDERWQNARDVKWELELIAERTMAPASSIRNTLLAALAGITALLLIALAVVYFRQRPSREPVARMNILLPESSVVRSLAVSPDGKYMAVVLLKDGKQQIWIRALDAFELSPLAGTEDAVDPFWSPDSRSIGFFADSRLKKIDRLGGPVQTLCAAMGAVGGTWNRNGEILIGSLSQVQRISDSGGTLSNLPGHPAVTQIFPVFLPDGRHYLGTRYSDTAASRVGVWLNSLDGPESIRILPDLSRTEVMAPPAGSQIGAILFSRAGTLMSLPFDMKRLEPVGDPVPLARQLAVGTNSNWLMSSSSRVLAYVSGRGAHWQYVWRDREGKQLGAFGDAGGVVAISPDGKRLVGDPESVITTVELGSGATTRLTFGSSRGQNPVWSRDGRYIAYNGEQGIYRKAINGGAPEELLFRRHTFEFPKDWSPDGRYLVYAQVSPGRGSDLFLLPIGEREPHPLFLATADQAQFSPDGRWFAYTSSESGQSEIYVMPFPPAPNGARWQVSRGGGVMPRWRRDGKELFFISPDWKMMAVDVSTSSSFESGTPHALFDTHMVDTGIRNGPMSWDVAPDGKRFLIISDDSEETGSVSLVLNWRPDQQK